jgi:hypothetical protein
VTSPRTSAPPLHTFTLVPRGPPSNPVAPCLRLRSASRPRAPAAPHASLEASPTEATSTDRSVHASAIVARISTQPSSSREAPPSSTAPPSSIEFTCRRAVPVVDAFDVAGHHPPSISSRSHRGAAIDFLWSRGLSCLPPASNLSRRCPDPARRWWYPRRRWRRSTRGFLRNRTLGGEGGSDELLSAPRSGDGGRRWGTLTWPW